MSHETTHTLIIGAGQAGLAAARSLSELGLPAIVLERGKVGERWRSRWDSLRLLTPNWMTRLPGQEYEGEAPDGFMSRDELVEFFEGYARTSAIDVREGVTVNRVRADGRHFVVETTRGIYRAPNVVVATGHADVPAVPADLSGGLHSSLHQLHSSEYRNPDQLPGGGVLVVGSGASGLQLAAELRRSGRKVVLSVGRHARAVRRYRGMDLWWWLEGTGTLAVNVDQAPNIDAARRTPSLGLTGAAGGVDIDLGTLRRLGVEPVGRLIETDGCSASFDTNLGTDMAEADRRLVRLLDRFDAHAATMGLDGELEAPCRPVPLRAGPSPTSLDLAEAGISTVLWSTGYRRRYDWLDVPVIDETGEIIQRRGATPAPGLFVLGLRFQWTRGSHFIDGVGADARHVAEMIANRRASLVA